MLNYKETKKVQTSTMNRKPKAKAPEILASNATYLSAMKYQKSACLGYVLVYSDIGTDIHGKSKGLW